MEPIHSQQGSGKSSLRKRFFMFLVGCIGVRVAIVILAYLIYPEYLPYLGYLALIPAIGFASIYITGGRETGQEVGGGKIWWNCLRPLHSLLYFLFAYNGHHYNEGSFQKLF